MAGESGEGSLGIYRGARPCPSRSQRRALSSFKAVRIIDVGPHIPSLTDFTTQLGSQSMKRSHPMCPINPIFPVSAAYSGSREDREVRRMAM